MEDRRLERSTSCEILAWSLWQKDRDEPSESTPGEHGACVSRTAHHAVEERTSPTRVPKLKVNPARGAHFAREIGVNMSAPPVWWRLKDIFMDTPSEGQPSGGALPARQRRMPELAVEIQRKAEEDEELEGEVVQDLIGDVHMMLSVPPESRENRGPARVCNCTVFEQRESAIIPKMHIAGWL